MKMCRIAFLLFSIAYFATNSLAAFGAVMTVTASGQGSSQAEAVATALADAVKQATGVYVESNQNFNDLIVSTEQNYVTKGSERQVRTLQNIGQNSVRIKSGALVKNYIIEQIENKNDKFFVIIKADIDKYKSNINFAESRPKLLIDNLMGESSYLKNQIYSGVLEKLTNSNHFTIVDRRYLDRYQKELDLIRSPQASTADKQKLGQIMSTDFILNIEIMGFRCQDNELYIAVTKEVERTRTCKVDVSYQISELATSIVILANKFSREIKNNMRLGGSINSEIDQLNSLSEIVLSKISIDIIDGLFPMFIEGFNGNSAIVNSSGRSPKLGDRFQILKIIKEGQSDYGFKFWGARLQLVGEIQLSKFDNGSVIGSILGDDIARDGDFVLKPLLTKESNSLQPVIRERKSVLD